MALTTDPTSTKEVFYEVNTNNLIGNTAVAYVYPPLDLYNHEGQVVEPYINRPNDKVVNADIAFLKLHNFVDTNQQSNYQDGFFNKTNVGGSFYAVEANDYYYKYNVTETTLTAPALQRSTNKPKIGEAIKLPNGSIGGTFENKSLGMASQNVNRYDDIDVDGLNEGYKPTNMACTALRFEDVEVEDVAYRCFDAASILASGGKVSDDIDDANAITSQVSHFAGVDADFIDENSNLFVHEDGAYNSSNPYSEYVSAVEIVNIERDLDDLRYGDEEDDLPFIFTGASHYFSDAELTTTGGSGVQGGSNVPINISVWGGDCYVGLHTFKVNDTSYVLTDAGKGHDAAGGAMQPTVQTSRWGYWFDKNSASVAAAEDTSRPFPVKGAAQTITVLLESEVNPEFMEQHKQSPYC
jgi:hypothetical protein